MPSTEPQSALPNDIEPPPEIPVNLCLASHGETTVNDRRDGLGLPLLSVLTLLNALEFKGWVRQEDAGYRPASSTA